MGKSEDQNRLQEEDVDRMISDLVISGHSTPEARSGQKPGFTTGNNTELTGSPEATHSGDLTAAEKLLGPIKDGFRPTERPPEKCWTGFKHPDLAYRFEVGGFMKTGLTCQLFFLRDRQHDGKPMVCKVLRPELERNDTLRQRFVERAAIYRRLNHANIVATDPEDGSKNDVPVLLMDHVEGKDLKTVLAHKVIPRELFLEVFLQLCNALGHTHARGIVHGSITPSGVMLSPAGRSHLWVKLLGFGMQSGCDTFHIANGTDVPLDRELCCYVSPEYHSGRKIDPRSDIFSLGCLMYEAVSGRPSFVGNNAEEVIEAKRSKRPRNLMDIAQQNCLSRLDLVINKCLEKEPDNRYQSIFSLREDLMLVAEGQEPHLSSKKIARPKSVDIKGITTEENQQVASQLTCVIEGQLNVRSTVKSLLELILETAYPGYSLLRLESAEPKFAGLIVIRGGFECVSAKILRKDIHGYEALRRLFRIAVGDYQYLTITSDRVKLPESNLCLNLNSILAHYPDLPGTQTDMMSFSSAVDLIFNTTSNTTTLEEQGSWNSLEQDSQPSILEQMGEQSGEQGWVAVEKQEVASSFHQASELEQLVTGRHMKADFDRHRKKVEVERRKAIALKLLIAVAVLIFLMSGLIVMGVIKHH